MWLNVRNSDGDESGAALDTSLVVGRETDNALVIADERASRHHARFTAQPDGSALVEDLGSTNGTWVNGARIGGATLVHPGDEIRIGRHVLALSAAAPAAAAPPPPPMPSAPTADPTWAAAPAWSPAPAAQEPQAPQPPPPPAAEPVGAWNQAPQNLPQGPPQPPPQQASPWGSAPDWGQGSAPAGPSGPRGKRRTPFVVGAVILAVVVIAAVVVVVTQLGGGSSKLTTAQISRKWGPSTLYVEVSDQGQPVESGSAWVYNAGKGLLVTNAHVVDGGTSYTVGQGAKKQKATLVGVDPCEDLAVLHVSQTAGLKSFPLSSQESTQNGDNVVALGYPAGVTSTPALSTTTGIVSIVKTKFQGENAADTPDYPNVLQTTAPINPGNSGGPLLNSKGQLVGVNTAGLSQDQSGQAIQNENYAIGVDRVKSVIPGLSSGQMTGFTGMNLVIGDQDSYEQYDLPETDGGIIVPDAQPGSPAAKAKFGQGGDGPVVITSINGQDLDGTLVSYCKIVGQLGAGKTASFHGVLSGGGDFDVTVPFE